MESYTILWPNDWVKTIFKNGDTGPLQVIYGGPHISQPPLGEIKTGDIIYPVRVEKGQLYILGRITVSEIMDADEYISKKLNISKDLMWDQYTYVNKKTITHIIPRTCADHAAVGTNGTTLENRLFPGEKLSLLMLGAKKGKETPLKYKNGMLSSICFQGHFRRLSEESAKLFEEVFF